jgi:flagellar biogenesis protein FliO
MENLVPDWLKGLRSRLRAWPAWVWGVAAIIALGALAFLWDTGQPGATQDPFAPPDWSILLSVMLKLGVVLALIYIGLFLLKKGRMDGAKQGPQRLVLLETLRFSPKQAVHMLRADGRTLVVGATDQAVALLAQWPEDEEELDLSDLSEQ